MRQSFIFGSGTENPTYEDLRRKREQLEQMREQSTSRFPQTFGEGLTAIGQALAGRVGEKRLRKQEETERERIASALMGAVGGRNDGASPFMTGGISDNPGRLPQSTVDAVDRASPPQRTGGSRGEFIQAMMPHAMRVSEQTGLDPRLVIAQAAQETGWGKSAPNNNYFGIKSHGKPGGARLSTREHLGGQNVTVRDSFRTYDGMGESAQGYAEFLQENPRYREMLSAGDLEGQLSALGRSGYATDPSYASSVGSIARSIPMDAFTPGAGVQTADAGGINPQIIEQLSSIVGNPYASPGQQAVAEALLGRQMQGSDPMRQLDMQYKQAQIDRLQNPEQKLPASVEEYQFAQQNGFDGSYQDWVTMKGQSSAPSVSTTVNTGDQPDSRPMADKPAKGFQRRWDPERESWVDEPIPGGEVEREMQSLAEKEAGRAAQTARAGSTVIQDLQRAADLLPELGALSKGEGVIGGIARAQSAKVHGTVANRITQFTESALSNVGLDTLQQMRENSPTGGALGQVPIQQQQRLEQVLGSLNINQPPSVLEANIKRVMNIYTDIIHGDAKERARAVEQGKMSPEQNAEIEGYYYDLPFDERGRAVGGASGGLTFEQFSADPSAQAAADRYGVTLEEMWEIKNRGQ